MRAARNLIVHGHICIGDQRMTVPGTALKEEEDSLQYSETLLNDPEHPFRKELETLRYQEDNEEEFEEDSAEEEES